MAIPQLRAEGVDQTGGSTAFTINFSGFTFQANDILELVMATDGWVPVITTANGWALAQDPVGNTASATTNGGVAGAAECGIFVYWKRAVGATATTDPPPVFQAPSAQSGTSWCLQPNSFSGARTSGTPYNAITTGIVTTATTAVTSVSATSTLASCLFMPRVASANDDSAFNNWTMTGSAAPSGTKAPDTGWHAASGNACAFTGDEGGFATAGTHTGTTTFSVATKQALTTLVMASLAEAAAATGNESATLGPSSAASSGGVTATGTAADTLAASSPAVAGAVAVTGTEAPTLGASTAASFGSTITRTGNEAAGLDNSIASSSGTITSGRTGNETALLGASSSAAAGAVAVTGTESAALAASSGASTGAVSLTGTGTAALDRSTAAAAGTVTSPTTLAIGKFGIRQKANTTTTPSPLTTFAVYPAWQASHLYTLSDAIRVTNGGNIYELTFPSPTASGTSAASGGPTGTGAGIVDGGCRWNYLGPGTGACDTQPSGSFFVASVAWGRDATGGAVPGDNKSNLFSLVAKHFYASFTASSQATYTAADPATGGSGHTLTAAYGAGNDGGLDECTVILGEILGGKTLVDHSYVENNPVSNVVTSASVTTTGAAVLVAFWWLNGVVRTSGTNHDAVPGSGFAAIPEATALMEIGPSGAGEVQVATHFRQVASAGTYTASITTTGGEGAAVHLLAIQGTPGITGTEAALSGASTAASSGTVTTPRTGTAAAALAPSSATAAGTVSLTASASAGAAVDSPSRGSASGAVAVTGTAANTSSGSTAASSGTLVPVINGAEAAALGASISASFGSVLSGHVGQIGLVLGGSLGAAAGGVLATGAAALLQSSSSPAAAGAIAVAGAVALTSSDSVASSRGRVGLPGGVFPRLTATLGTNGQLAGTLQLQGVTVADIVGPITVYRGDTASYLLTVLKDDGQPFDLTLASAIDVRVKPADGAADPPTIALAVGSGVDLLSTPGQATITFGTSDTDIPEKRYRLNVVVTAPGLRQHVIKPQDFVIAAVD